MKKWLIALVAAPAFFYAVLTLSYGLLFEGRYEMGTRHSSGCEYPYPAPERMADVDLITATPSNAEFRITEYFKENNKVTGTTETLKQRFLWRFGADIIPSGEKDLDAFVFFNWSGRQIWWRTPSDKADTSYGTCLRWATGQQGDFHKSSLP